MDLYSVTINGTEGLRIPEHITGEGVSAQPLNTLAQFFCALLDISEERIVVGCEWSLFRGAATGSRALDPPVGVERSYLYVRL